MTETAVASRAVEQLPLGSELTQDPSEMAPAVAQFQELVRQGALSPRVLEFHEVRGHGADNPDKTITQNCVEAVIASTEDEPNDRFYVDSEEAAVFLGGRNQRSNLSRTSIGETSAHQVFFVALAGNAGRLRVAVKPFENGRGALAAEWTNTLIAREKGFGAFRPLGFVATAEGGYMLTERRDDIEPMDNVDWAGVLLDPEGNADMIEDMKKFGPLLARLHESGGFHGDPQVKNGVLTEEGELDFIDWESAKFTEAPVWGKNTAGREEYLLGRAERDMKVLFASLARSVADKGVGFLDGFTPQTQWSFFREYIFTPYIEERLKLAAETPGSDEEAALLHLSELEAVVEKYILDGEMYKALARTRTRF